MDFTSQLHCHPQHALQATLASPLHHAQRPSPAQHWPLPLVKRRRLPPIELQRPAIVNYRQQGFVCLALGPNMFTKHSPTLPTVSTGNEAITQQMHWRGQKKEIDAERHLAAAAAGLDVTAEPETTMTDDETASVLRSPDRGPGFDVSAFPATIRVPRMAAGGRPK